MGRFPFASLLTWRWGLLLAASLCCDTSFQRIHKVYDLCRSPSFRSFDPLACLLLGNQLTKCLFIAVLEFFGTEVPSFRLHNVLGELHRILAELCVPDVVEVILFVADLIGKPKQRSHNSFTAWLQGNDVLATREHDSCNRDHVHFFNDFPDHDKRVLSNLAIRDDVVRTNIIEFIDLLARNELFNLDSARALQRNGFKFFVGYSFFPTS
jgi:hypothetical protein